MKKYNVIIQHKNGATTTVPVLGDNQMDALETMMDNWYDLFGTSAITFEHIKVEKVETE